MICLAGTPLLANQADPYLDPDADAEQLLDWILSEPAPETGPPAASWKADLSLQGGVGYKENVLFSAVHPLDSGFSMVEADLFLLRTGSVEQDVFVYAYADQRHYFELDRGEDEQMFLAEINWTRRTSPATLSLKGHYSYIDQFFDASFSTADILSNRLRQHEGSVNVFAEREIVRSLHLGVGGAARDVDVEDFPDDFWAWEALAQLEFRPRPGMATGINYRHIDEDYSERPQRTAEGEAIPDTTTHIIDERLGVYGRWRWGAHGQWGAHARLTGVLRTDDGGGYYDYQAWWGRLLLRGPMFGWKWEGGMYYGDTDYDVRPSSYGVVASPRLYRTWRQVRLRFHRDLGVHWSCFAEMLLQDNRSNNPLDVYDYRWVALGIGFRS